MKARLRQFLWPALIGALIIVAGIWVKVWWEGQRQLDFIAEHVTEAEGDHLVLPELTFAAMQVAPGSAPAREAAGRLQALTTSNKAPTEARRALAVASSGARGLGRPHREALEATGADALVAAAEARVATPSWWWRFAALLLLLGWWGGAGAWIWLGHDPKGAPTPARRWSAPLSLACFVGWCAAMFMV